MAFDLEPTARLLSDLRVLHDTSADKDSGKRATIRRAVKELERLGDEIHRQSGRKGKWEKEARRPLKEPAASGPKAAKPARGNRASAPRRGKRAV